MHNPLLGFARWAAPSLLSWSAAAQCLPTVPAGSVLAGLDGVACSVAEWDPDGAGPKGLHWVFAGDFRVAGDKLAGGIAMFDPVAGQWSTLGGGLTEAFGLLPLSNGQLLAVRRVSSATSTDSLWLWNGSQWQVVPGAPIGQVAAMVRMQNGDVVVGGGFSVAGGQACANVARWNGTSWAPLGAGITGSVSAGGFWGSFVSALLVDGNGDLWAGGAFTTAGAVPARSIARWDGTNWANVGSGLQESPNVADAQATGVQFLRQLPQGDIVAAGRFGTAGATTVNGTARWDGNTWLPMGSGLTGVVSMAVDANGALWAVRAGLGMTTSNALVRWDGAAWQPLPYGSGPSGLGASLRSCTPTSSGRLVVTGSFLQIQDPARRADSVAVLQAGVWSSLAGPASGLAGGDCLFATTRGRTLALGAPSFAGAQVVVGAAEWTTSGWAPLAGSPRLVHANVAATLANGDLVVGGTSPTSAPPWSVGGQPAGPLVRYDGSTWTRFGGFGIQPNGQGVLSLRSLLPRSDGSLIVGGAFGSLGGVPVSSIARWDGLTWRPLGSGVTGEVRAIAQLPNGDLVVAGTFWNCGAVFCLNVARWNGAAWSPMGAGIGSPFSRVEELVVLRNGDVLACGQTGAADFLVRWDGTAWVDASAGLPIKVHSMTVLPSQEVLLAATLKIASPTWTPKLLIGDGLSPWRDFSAQPGSFVDATPWRLHATAAGEVLVRGPIRELGGVPAFQVATILPGCPAVVNVVGTGCVGSGGQDTLTSEALPFLGGVARARATGLPNEAMVVFVLGVAPANVPLASLSPLALPGCDVRTSIDLYGFADVTGGSVPFDLPLPLVPALVGAILFEQVLSLGFTSAAPFEATSTNALELQLGLFGG